MGRVASLWRRAARARAPITERQLAPTRRLDTSVRTRYRVSQSLRSHGMTSDARRCIGPQGNTDSSGDDSSLVRHKCRRICSQDLVGCWEASRADLQLRRRCRMVCLRRAVAPGPFCSAMLRRLLYTPRTVSAAGCISIVCGSSTRPFLADV